MEQPVNSGFLDRFGPRLADVHDLIAASGRLSLWADAASSEKHPRGIRAQGCMTLLPVE
jgi:hypothetical protein